MIKAGKVNKRTNQYEFHTGAQVHTTNKLWCLTDLKPGKTITACNGTKTTATHEGTLKLWHNGRYITLKNVVYHPSFYNLISGQRIKEDSDIKGRGNSVDIQAKREILYHAERDNSGTMRIKPEDMTDTYVPVNKVTLMDLHKTYGHISFDTLKILPEVASKYHGKSVSKCKACIAGKSVKPSAKAYNKPNRKITQIRSNQLLERIHTDLLGPFKECLGKKYALTMMDDYSRYCIAIPIQTKSDTTEKVKDLVNLLEN